MIKRWRTYVGWLALLLTLTACPSDPPEIIVATATGQADAVQPSGEIDPHTRDKAAPPFSTVTDGSLRFVLLSFERAPEAPAAEPLEAAPSGTQLAALDLRVECLEDDDHCDLTVSEFQLLAGDDLYTPIESFSAGETLVPGSMQRGDFQQTTLYYYLPLDRDDFIFRYNPLDDLWADTVYIALPK